MNTVVHFDFFDSPIGRMRLAGVRDGLTGIAFDGDRYAAPQNLAWVQDPAFPMLRRAARQLAAYFAGELQCFEVPLTPTGTPFQRAVWDAISSVPAGATISYAELARRAGHEGSARAAGAATGRNPLAIVIPCHRIVGADGSLTGYAGGLDRKRALLALEQRVAHLRSAA
jgi:methylated-DNA-[protein]-cysteine S-methyltransferase